MMKKNQNKTAPKFPIVWKKKDFSIKIFCSIPNIATGILLTAGKNHFVIDPGDGILRDLSKELGVESLKNISHIFVTHGHHDHLGGVWSLLTYLRVMNKTSPLKIYYPAGCVEIESIYHAFTKVYSHNLPYKIELKKISEEKKFSVKNVSVKPFAVIHKEYLPNTKGKRIVPALGFHFNYNGTAICYGGDTGYCDSLVKAAKGADLAILEAGHEESTPDDMHMTMDEAQSIGKSAKKYVLVHIPE
ncbi:MAG: ribonuclease Z [Ignavibacteriaceae bacterium]|nr:ribonuclease Z [Ignavibacteriaceae bacterium]